MLFSLSGGHNSCCLVYPFSQGRNLYNKSVLSSILKDKVLYLWLYVTTYLAKCGFETIFYARPAGSCFVGLAVGSSRKSVVDRARRTGFI